MCLLRTMYINNRTVYSNKGTLYNNKSIYINRKTIYSDKRLFIVTRETIYSNERIVTWHCAVVLEILFYDYFSLVPIYKCVNAMNMIKFCLAHNLFTYIVNFP